MPIFFAQPSMTTRKRKTISEYIADRIIRNQMRVKFSHAHADYLQERANEMRSPTSSNGLNTTVTHEATLDRSTIGSPADGRKLNGTGTAGSSLTSDMACGSQVTVGPIKPVDRKTLEGSTPGDFRSQAEPVNMDEFKNPPSPREQMAGQQNSRNYNENGKAFQSTSNSPDSDAGN